MRPLAITGSPARPASSSASSAARTASCETRPMLRSCLRVQRSRRREIDDRRRRAAYSCRCSGPTRPCDAIAFRRACRPRTISGQLSPSAETPPMPVTTTRLHQHNPPLTREHLARHVRRVVRHQERHAAATSSAVPTRCIGISFRISSSGTCSSTMSVSISPGATQLTVIWRFASSTASALVAPMMPALAAL